MAAEKGNKYWQKRKKHGKEKNIKTAQELWELACDYFQWTEDHPLLEQKGFAFQGTVTKEHFNKMRAFTWDGFEDFLFEKGVVSNLDDYKANKEGRYKDYTNIITRINKIIRNHKFQGAAAELLNPNIIARDLGLIDKQDLHHSGEIETKQINIAMPDGATINLGKYKGDKNKSTS